VGAEASQPELFCYFFFSTQNTRAGGLSTDKYLGTKYEQQEDRLIQMAF
jgi:hypothetical protein